MSYNTQPSPSPRTSFALQGYLHSWNSNGSALVGMRQVSKGVKLIHAEQMCCSITTIITYLADCLYDNSLAPFFQSQGISPTAARLYLIMKVKYCTDEETKPKLYFRRHMLQQTIMSTFVLGSKRNTFQCLWRLLTQPFSQ